MSKKSLRDRKIKRLREYLQKQGDVSLAFLFGSQARGMVTEESDFDIALYMKEGSKEDLKKTIWLEIVKILEKEADLVFLNDAPATLISSLFKTGVPLVIKNRKLYWRLYLKNSLEAEDFFYFINDYWKIRQRAMSLSPEDKIF
ncbi:MAG: nucleotidyltransferase domain-containing protein [Nitrospinae bacterium]|nr:nucleotidyltransferase domain-containing protein [Nitrospinota bacterium]